MNESGKQSMSAQVIESDAGVGFLSFDADSFDGNDEFLSDFQIGNGVWCLEEGSAVFYPASEHPNVVRGYN